MPSVLFTYGDGSIQRALDLTPGPFTYAFMWSSNEMARHGDRVDAAITAGDLSLTIAAESALARVAMLEL